MMVFALVAVVAGHGEFGPSMNRYIACLSTGIPSDLHEQNLETRARVYRVAAAHCVSERQDAIDAAVRDRQPDVSEASARAQAIDIIDTLDPMSSCRVPGAQC
jgi:hypothetical protein